MFVVVRFCFLVIRIAWGGLGGFYEEFRLVFFFRVDTLGFVFGRRGGSSYVLCFGR